MLSQISIRTSSERHSVDLTDMAQNGTLLNPLRRDSEIPSLKSYSSTIGNAIPISDEKNTSMGSHHRISPPFHSSSTAALPHVIKKKGTEKSSTVCDIHQRAKALAKETERRRRAALEKKIRMQKEERRQREQLSRERRERARYGMKIRSNTNDKPDSFGGGVGGPGSTSDSTGHRIMLHSAGNGSEPSDSFCCPSRPLTAATLTSQSFDVFKPTRDVKSAQSFIAPSENDDEEDDDQMDQIAMKSERGDSPPLGALDVESFNSRCGSPSGKSSVGSQMYQYSDVSHVSPRKVSTFPSDVGMACSTQTRPTSRASHSSAGSRKSIVGKVEVVYRNDRRMRLVKGTYVEIAGDAQSHTDLEASGSSFNESTNSVQFQNRIHAKKEPTNPVSISKEKNVNIDQAIHRNASARREKPRPGSVRFSKRIDQRYPNENSNSDWDFSTFSISGGDATESSTIQRPYSAVTDRVRIHQEVDSLYSDDRQRRRPSSAYSYEPSQPKSPIPISSKPPAISRTVAAPRKDPVRSEQYSKIPVACRTTAFSNAPSTMRPTRADLLLARVESMLRREGSRRTEPSTFFPHPPLSRYASAPSFMMKNAVDALPGDELRVVLESRLERARNKSMPRRWVDKRTASRNEMVAQVRQTGTGRGIELPPLFPTRLARWRSAPGQGTGIPETTTHEGGRTVGFSPFHTGLVEPRSPKRRNEKVEKGQPSFGEIDESLRVFLLTEQLCQYEELSVNEIIQAVDLHSQQQIHAPSTNKQPQPPPLSLSDSLSRRSSSSSLNARRRCGNTILRTSIL